MAERWHCWLDDERREDGDVVETVYDDDTAAEYAAEAFVTKRERQRAFAGDPMPDVITVYALAPSGRLYRVEIVPKYSVDFYTRRRTTVEGTEATGAG